jgi:hypothetical protein
MAKRRYLLELTREQMLMVGSALEVYELDLTGGCGFDDDIYGNKRDEKMSNYISVKPSNVMGVKQGVPGTIFTRRR